MLHLGPIPKKQNVEALRKYTASQQNTLFLSSILPKTVCLLIVPKNICLVFKVLLQPWSLHMNWLLRDILSMLHQLFHYANQTSASAEADSKKERYGGAVVKPLRYPQQDFSREPESQINKEILLMVAACIKKKFQGDHCSQRVWNVKVWTPNTCFSASLGMQDWTKARQWCWEPKTPACYI